MQPVAEIMDGVSHGRTTPTNYILACPLLIRGLSRQTHSAGTAKWIGWPHDFSHAVREESSPEPTTLRKVPNHTNPTCQRGLPRPGRGGGAPSLRVLVLPVFDFAPKGRKSACAAASHYPAQILTDRSSSFGVSLAARTALIPASAVSAETWRSGKPARSGDAPTPRGRRVPPRRCLVPPTIPWADLLAAPFTAKSKVRHIKTRQRALPRLRRGVRNTLTHAPATVFASVALWCSTSSLPSQEPRRDRLFHSRSRRRSAPGS